MGPCVLPPLPHREPLAISRSHTPVVQTQKLRCRGMLEPVPGHTAGRWLSPGVSPGLSDTNGHVTSREHSVRIRRVGLLSFGEFGMTPFFVSEYLRPFTPLFVQQTSLRPDYICRWWGARGGSDKVSDREGLSLLKEEAAAPLAATIHNVISTDRGVGRCCGTCCLRRPTKSSQRLHRGCNGSAGL